MINHPPRGVMPNVTAFQFDFPSPATHHYDDERSGSYEGQAGDRLFVPVRPMPGYPLAPGLPSAGNCPHRYDVRRV